MRYYSCKKWGSTNFFNNNMNKGKKTIYSLLVRMKRVAGLTKREVPLLHYIIPLQEYHDAHHDRMDDHPGHHVLRRRSDVPCRHVHVLRRRGVIFIGRHPTK